MILKRLSFIAGMLAVFAVCFYWMNQSYDPLARYPYADEADREILLKYLDQEDINYLISQQIRPEEIMPFIEQENFEIANTRWYALAMKTQEDDAAYIINFINEYKSRLDYSTLETVLTHYSYNDLIRYFESSDDYDEDSQLISDPSYAYLVLQDHQTVFNYEPASLTLLQHVPVVSTSGQSKGFYLCENAVEALSRLLSDATEINGKEGGGLRVAQAYTSFEAQVSRYETAQEDYGDAVSWYSDVPGESEFQLGYTVRFELDDEWEKNVEEKRSGERFDYADAESALTDLQRQQISWLRENAYRYGFVIRYEEGKEHLTGKTWQPFTLRYVGEEYARTMHDNDLCMEEMTFNKE